MKWLYTFIDGRWLVNLPICIMTGYGCIQVCKNKFRKNNINFNSVLTLAVAIFILIWPLNIKYANIIWQIDYREFLVCLLSAILATELYRWYQIKKNSEQQENICIECIENCSKGLSSDLSDNGEMPESLKNFANEIVSRLKATDVRNMSYAIGITGGWGVGKTKFLGQLRKLLQNSAEVVDFNPWMCRTPEQLTLDFFASLRHQLTANGSLLYQSIGDYAKAVNGVTLKSFTLFGAELKFKRKEPSLYEKKKELSSKFSELSKPIVVLIDDIDRLERDEVFEVLRLIRNTADLHNTVYIVAYDKEYVTCVLEEKNIKDASFYLEKIFPLEVHLPKVEDEQIWKTLLNDIKEQLNAGESYADQLFSRFSDSQRSLIIRILNTYRRAKRFARQYALNHGHTSRQISHDIRAIDLFWIELLQMYDHVTYVSLANTPYELLWMDGESYKLKSGICSTPSKDDRHAYTGKRFWKTETPVILKQLFEDSRHITKYNLCLVENYSKYFSFNVSSFRLSAKELNGLFEDGADVKSIVSSWIMASKYLNSICFQLEHVDINRLSDAHLKAYIEGIVYFALLGYSKHWSPVWKVKKMLHAKRFNDETARYAHDIMRNWFNELSNEETNLLKLAKILKDFYASIDYDEKGEAEPMMPTLLSNNEIETLLQSLMRRYLNNHGELTALDLFKRENDLYKLFTFCCVCINEPNYEEGIDFGIYKQVALPVIINHFAESQNKPSIEECESAIDKLFSIEDAVLVNPGDEDAYWDYMEEKRDHEIDEFWGSDAQSEQHGGLDEFKSKCFMSSAKPEVVVPSK